MKSETRKIVTRKSIRQIQERLRAFPCECDFYQDPLGIEAPVISVLMHGRPKFYELFTHPGGGDALWAVTVEVFDRTDVREVVLTAIGTGYWGAGWNRYKTGSKSFMLDFSRDYMKKIIAALSAKHV